MAVRDERETPRTFGARLAVAIDAEKKSRSRTEREVGLGRGRIQRLLGLGKNPILSPGPDVIRLLADYLHVSYEWLAIGRGPMRSKGWAPSELESAMVFARAHGTREDAIAAAVERFRGDDAELTAVDWVLAFDGEARRLDRAGIPRPEVVAAVQKQTSRLTEKRKRLLKELGELEARESPRSPHTRKARGT